MENKKTEFREQLRRLLKAAVKTGEEFTLSSGKKSDFFINCKQVSLTPLGQRLSSFQFNASLDYHEISLLDGVAGVPIGGYPLADAFSRGWGDDFPILYVRKQAKDHGTKLLVEGNLQPNMNIVLLEDVITSGASVISAIEILKSQDCNVIKVMALVDREEGGKEEVLKHVPSVNCLFTKTELLLP